MSAHQAHLGLAVAETLSLGTPALLAEQVNIAQDVAASGAGFVEPDTFPGTLRLIERWLQDGSPTMRSAASNCFQSRFDIEETARELMSIISDDG